MSKYNPEVHHRKSIRLKDYNYSKEGMYFITICTKNRECILSQIRNGKIYLNVYGNIVKQEIKRTEKIREQVKINNYIIMPNHIHMIIELKDVGVAWYATQKDKKENIVERSKMLIPKIIQQLKMVTTKKGKQNITEKGLHTMQPLQWQRNYYEHIIRNEKEYYEICKYIQNNPLNWENDRFNC